jgi:hypothetical protein
MSQWPNDLVWARWLAGELGPAERLRLWWACRRDPAVRAERDARVAERNAFDARPERADEVARLVAVGAAEAGRAPHRRPWWPWAAAVLVATGVAVVLLPRSPDLRPKGGDLFVLEAERDGRVERLGPICSAGLAVRARVETQEPLLLVLGRDDTGVVQVLYPIGGRRSAPVPPVGTSTPGSWILDDTPGTQRFLAVFSRDPVDAGAAAAWFEGPPPAGITVARASCEKTP